MRYLLAILFFASSALAADITKYVVTTTGCGGNDGSIGNPYCSCSEWEAAEQTDLVAAGDTHTVIMSGSTADTTSCTIDGWTTGASNWLLIKTDEAARHSGVWSTSHYRLEAGYTIMDVNENYVTIDGLQFYVGRSTDDNGHRGVDIAGGTNITIRNSIFRLDTAAQVSFGNDSRAIEAGIDTAGPHYIYNNLFYDFNTGTSYAIKTLNYTSSSMFVWHNTFDNNDVGILDGYSDVDARNNLFTNTTTAMSGSTNASSTYNVADNATLEGLNQQESVTVTYTNEAGDDFHTSDTDVQVNNNLYASSPAITVDGSDGDARPSSGVVYAGWDENAAASSVNVAPLLTEIWGY